MLTFCIVFAFVFFIFYARVASANQCSATVPCPAGLCCSKYGYCGSNSTYCGANCMYQCPTETPPISSQCNANSPCANGGCCSKYGYCGVTPAYCGIGCLSQCAQSPPPLSKTNCSASLFCANNLCCSSFGFCGDTEAYCGVGCLSQCSKASNMSGTQCNATSVCPGGLCCSQYGFCGSTPDYCGIGCLSQCPTPTFGKSSIVGVAVGVAVGVVFAFSLFTAFFLLFCLVGYERSLHPCVMANSENKHGFMIMKKAKFEITISCEKFSLEDISYATDAFNEINVVVSSEIEIDYKGITGSGQCWLVKRALEPGLVSRKQFKTQVALLSQLSDTSVLPIVGYCEEAGEQILVFLRLPSAMTLRKALDQNSLSGGLSLPLSQRIDIALGVASGLNYFHNFSDSHKVIHGHLTSSNVLLDSDLTPKLCEFGLSLLGSGRNGEGVRSTEYTAPELPLTNVVTTQSDVFSFGVVLIELVTGNRPVLSDPNDVSVETLVSRVKAALVRNDVVEICDPGFVRDVRVATLEVLLEVAVECTSEEASLRPAIDDVISRLKDIQFLQRGAPYATFGTYDSV